MLLIKYNKYKINSKKKSTLEGKNIIKDVTKHVSLYHSLPHSNMIYFINRTYQIKDKY